MKSFVFLSLLAAAALFSMGCFGIQTGKPFEHIAPGDWRGTFVVDAAGKERIPAMFHVHSDTKGKPQKIEFRDGEHKIASDSLRFVGDTVWIYFHSPKTHLRLIYEVNIMEGFLYDETEKQYPVKFQSQSGAFPRFPDVRRPPIADISGSWKALVASANDSSTFETTLQFSAKGNDISLLLPLADKDSSLTASTRAGGAFALAGAIQENKIHASGFDGRHVCYFSAEVSVDGKSLQKANLRIGEQQYTVVGSR
jgi:hypothetical protein